MSYDNTNQVILKKAVKEKDNSPDLRLELDVEGVKYKASLWVWTRKEDGSKVLDKNGNAQYKGKVERDTYGENAQRQGMAQARQAAAPDDFLDDFESDSIPFN